MTSEEEGFVSRSTARRCASREKLAETEISRRPLSSRSIEPPSPIKRTVKTPSGGATPSSTPRSGRTASTTFNSSRMNDSSMFSSGRDSGISNTSAHLDAEGRLVLRQQGLTRLSTKFNPEYSKAREVDISENELTSLLGKFWKCQKLMAAGNSLGRERFASMTGCLQYLDLSDNALESMENLVFLKMLETLKLARNFISIVPAASSFAHLKHVDLSGNSLQTMPNLSHLVALEELILADNMLTSFEGVIDCLPATLKELDISGNQVLDFSELLHFYGSNALSGLRHILLGGLPALEEVPVFYVRSLMICILPEIKFLDGYKISELEAFSGEQLMMAGKLTGSRRAMVAGCGGETLIDYLKTAVVALDETGTRPLDGKIQKILDERTRFDREQRQQRSGRRPNSALDHTGNGPFTRSGVGRSTTKKAPSSLPRPPMAPRTTEKKIAGKSSRPTTPVEETNFLPSLTPRRPEDSLSVSRMLDYSLPRPDAQSRPQDAQPHRGMSQVAEVVDTMPESRPTSGRSATEEEEVSLHSPYNNWTMNLGKENRRPVFSTSTSSSPVVSERSSLVTHKTQPSPLARNVRTIETPSMQNSSKRRSVASRLSSPTAAAPEATPTSAAQEATPTSTSQAYKEASLKSAAPEAPTTTPLSSGSRAAAARLSRSNTADSMDSNCSSNTIVMSSTMTSDRTTPARGDFRSDPLLTPSPLTARSQSEVEAAATVHGKVSRLVLEDSSASEGEGVSSAVLPADLDGQREEGHSSNQSSNQNHEQQMSPGGSSAVEGGESVVANERPLSRGCVADVTISAIQDVTEMSERRFLYQRVMEMGSQIDRLTEAHSQLTDLNQELVRRLTDQQLALNALTAEVRRPVAAMSPEMQGRASPQPPVPVALSVARRLDDRTVEVKWELQHVAGYHVFIDSVKVGHVSAPYRVARLSDLAPGQEHVIQLQAVGNNGVTGELSAPLMLEAVKATTPQ